MRQDFEALVHPGGTLVVRDRDGDIPAAEAVLAESPRMSELLGD
ncbi:hypothetical protein AB0J20_21920 [Micromonospora costi]